MKKVLNFVKGKKDDKGSSKINPQISVEITNPSGQKIPSDDEHIIGLQQGFGYSIDVNGKDKSMAKILKASWFGNLDKVKLYAKKADINAPDAHNRTCLHLAVAQGHTEVAWYLLNNNANITAADSDGLTPFLKAIECGQKDCTNLLIECGVDVNSADGDGNTGLHIASRSGFYNIASLLLKENANLNVPNNSGNFPLHLATSCDHRDIVELLIKYGAHVQVLDRERRTPLMLAARNGLTSIIKVLIENGALLETADSNGWTAEDYAQFGGHQDLMELLETKKKEVGFDQSDKLSVISSDQSEHVNFEVAKVTGVANEDSTDSPRSVVVIPPALEPPRSWDLLQSGVMDQDGSLENRKSLLSLGNLKKGYDSGSCELIVSPAELAPPSLSPSGDIPAEMRLSPEPLSLVPTPERRTRSPLERGHSFDLPSDNDSPLQGLSSEEINTAMQRSEGNQRNDNGSFEPCVDVSKINNNVMGSTADNATVISNPRAFESCVNSLNGKNHPHADNIRKAQDNESLENNLAKDNTYSMECSVSYDDLDERSYCTDNQLTGVSSSLDNMDYENGKALSIEIVQSTGNLDDTLSITTTKTNIFRECHSLELLEAEVGDSRSYKNSKRHHRNKSITLSGQPQLWKSVSTLPKTHSFDRGSIDAQLMCYDEALRQLANVKKSTEAKDAGSNTSPEISESKSNKLDQTVEPAENKSGCSSLGSFHANDFHTPDDDLEYLDRDAFPPPPMHFLENEDNDLCHLDCDDKSLQIDVLPMPISMLTPIKETQVECDSLSVAETFENEHSLSERSNLKSDGTPNHFNVEVIVNSKTPDVSRSFDDPVLPTDATETSLQLVDDVFIEDPTLAEPFDKYFVDLKALEMVPSAVDFNKIVFPADSPSPKKSVRNSSDKPSTMRAPGVGGSKDTDNDIDEDIDEDGDSEEDDPPFWQSTERGGCFLRQDTIVTKEPDLHHFRAEDIPTTSSGKPSTRRSCGSPLQNSEAETASASDTPRLSPMGAKEVAHLCEATLANGILQEKAAALMNSTERLQYELADARQAEAVREDTISILQCQLTRLEVQYAEAQEEVCTLKRKADCAELELKHLRELCACLSQDRKERSADTVKQLVDQATASTPTEEDYRQIQLQIMIRHLEDSKKLEEEKNHQLVRHLEDVLKANQNMISEKEALIAQNIADVRKLQEDTICWKDRYDELAAKLELLDKRLDPRLIEAQDTIATLKRTIAILQQEKSHSKRGSSPSRHRHSWNDSWIYEEDWIENLLKEVKSNFKSPVKVKVYKVTPCSKSQSDNSQSDSKISISIEELVSPMYPSGTSDVISTSSGRVRSETAPLPTETSVAKTRGEKKLESTQPGANVSPRSGSKRLTGELGKLTTPKTAHRTSVSRLASSDLSVYSDARSRTRTQSPDKDKPRDFVSCFKDGDVFYPAPGKMCRVICDDVPGSDAVVEKKQFATIQNEQENVLVHDETTRTGKCMENNQNVVTSMQSNDSNDPDLDERKQAPPKKEVEVIISGESEGLLTEECQCDASGTPDIPRKESKMAREEFKRRSTAQRSALPDVLNLQSDLSYEEHLEAVTPNPPVSAEMEPSPTIHEDSIKAVELPDKIQYATNSQRLADQMKWATLIDVPSSEQEAIPFEIEESEVKIDVDEPNDVETKTQTGSANENEPHDSANHCKEGGVYYPAPGKICRVVCEDVRSSDVMVESSVTTVGSLSGPIKIESVSSSAKKLSEQGSARGVEQVWSAPKPLEIHPEFSLTSAVLPPARGAEDSSTLTKLTPSTSKSGISIRTPSKGILKDPSLSRIRLAANSADKLKSPYKAQLPAEYEAVHPDMSRSNSTKKLMDVIEEESISSPAIEGTSKDPEATTLTSGSTAAAVSNFSVIVNPNDEIVVVSETGISSGLQLVPSSKSTIRSAKSIVESVTSSDSSSQMLISGTRNATLESASSQTPVIIALKTSSEQVAQLPSTSLGDGKRSSQTETISTSIMSNDKTPETAFPVQQNAGRISFISMEDSKNSMGTKQDGSAVSLSLKSSNESKDGPELHLTFGEVEQMSFRTNTLESTGSQIKPPTFKLLERPSVIKTNLPPIEEEVEAKDHHKEPSPSLSLGIAAQRRQSMVTPGMLKRKSGPSTFPSFISTASTYMDDESERSASEYSRCVSALDRCPCKKICKCCTCGQRGSEKPSFAVSRSASRASNLMDARSKSLSKAQLPRIGAIDMSSTPFPQNSLDVLRSPFYAHWDYYDLDQDHPIASYVRRPDQAEFDNTDTILVKNVRVGGYTIPYMKVQTKEKVTSKMVCNFYKTRKLPFRGKENPDENAMDFKDNIGEKSSDSMLGKEEIQAKKKCQCKSGPEEDNIWKDYRRDDTAELMDFPADVFLERSRCSQSAEEGCTCIDQPENARTVQAPPTPCESCDCFISDVEIESAPKLAAGHSGLIDNSDSADSIDKAAVVNEYICGLQELCFNLCGMIGKMRLVIDDTSTSGSTFRPSRASVVQLPKPSPQKPPDKATK